MGSDSDTCDKTYLWLEMGLTNLPELGFIVGGIINFSNIRSIGFNRVV